MTETYETPDPPSTREQAQIQLILDAFGDQVEVWPPNWRAVGVDYLYRANSFLTRDRDLPRIRELFPDGTVERGGINGLTRFTPRPDFEFPDGSPAAETRTQRLLAYVDWRLGTHVVTPDNLVYVCSVSPCPATEPEEVTPGSPPDPVAWTDGCDGRGVRAVVGDVGWTGSPAAYWLDGVTGDDERPFDPPDTDHIRPYAGHGRFIAGVLRGVARRTEVVVRRCFDRVGAEFESVLVNRLDALLDDSPDIISLSAGTNTRNDLPSLAFQVFVEERLSRVKDVVLVAAAGNFSDRRYFFPAASPGVVSVGALSEDRHARASFSDFGGWVDVYAPGTNLVNAFLTGRYECTEPPNEGEIRQFDGMARWSGTSFSTPLVAGLIAARMSRTGESARQAADQLLAYARRQAIPGLGPVLLPGDACASLDNPDHSYGCHHHCC
jgi:subtilisin family serine protease